MPQTPKISNRAKRVSSAGPKAKPQTLVEQLTSIRIRAQQYFNDVEGDIKTEGADFGPELWQALSETLKEESKAIETLLAAIFVPVRQAIPQSPFLTEIDTAEAGRAFKGMCAALRFIKYEHTEPYPIEDEDRIAVVVPEQESTDLKLHPAEAKTAFEEWEHSLSIRLELAEYSVEETDTGGFVCSPDYRSVKLRGKQFTLTKQQAAIIKILHEASDRGVPDVGLDYILTEIESPSSRLLDIFKSNKDAYKALIGNSGKKRGLYRLNL